MMLYFIKQIPKYKFMYTNKQMFKPQPSSSTQSYNYNDNQDIPIQDKLHIKLPHRQQVHQSIPQNMQDKYQNNKQYGEFYQRSNTVQTQKYDPYNQNKNMYKPQPQIIPLTHGHENSTNRQYKQQQQIFPIPSYEVVEVQAGAGSRNKGEVPKPRQYFYYGDNNQIMKVQLQQAEPQNNGQSMGTLHAYKKMPIIVAKPNKNNVKRFCGNIRCKICKKLKPHVTKQQKYYEIQLHNKNRKPPIPKLPSINRPLKQKQQQVQLLFAYEPNPAYSIKNNNNNSYRAELDNSRIRHRKIHSVIDIPYQYESDNNNYNNNLNRSSVRAGSLYKQYSIKPKRIQTQPDLYNNPNQPEYLHQQQQSTPKYIKVNGKIYEVFDQNNNSNNNIKSNININNIHNNIQPSSQNLIIPVLDKSNINLNKYTKITNLMNYNDRKQAAFKAYHAKQQKQRQQLNTLVQHYIKYQTMFYYMKNNKILAKQERYRLNDFMGDSRADGANGSSSGVTPRNRQKPQKMTLYRLKSKDGNNNQQSMNNKKKNVNVKINDQDQQNQYNIDTNKKTNSNNNNNNSSNNNNNNNNNNSNQMSTNRNYQPRRYNLQQKNNNNQKQYNQQQQDKNSEKQQLFKTIYRRKLVSNLAKNTILKDQQKDVLKEQDQQEQEKIEVYNIKFPKLQEIDDKISKYQPITLEADLKIIRGSKDFAKQYCDQPGKQFLYFGSYDHQKSQRKGFGVLVTKKYILQGTWIKNNIVKGAEMRANSLYKGQFRMSRKHGQGTCKWLNGQEYVGQWKDGVRNGHGFWKSKNGQQTYSGSWNKGKVYGYGQYIKKRVSTYKGNFQDFVKTGQGIQQFNNGDKFEGQYKNGLPHGFGSYKWACGLKFQGQFKKGDRQGRGCLSKQGIFSIQGQFQRQKPHGICQLKLANKDVFNGKYIDGQRYGYGKMQYHDRHIPQQGFWNHGFLKQKVSAPNLFNYQ